MHSPDSTASDYGTWRTWWTQDNQLLRGARSDPLNPDQPGTPIHYVPGVRPNELFGAIDEIVGKEKFFAHDAMGSVRTSHDSTGATIEATRYTAYGIVSGTRPKDSGFHGGLGAGDLVQFHNRYYDPVTGQFTTEDSIGFAGGKNLYAYAHNNPVNFTDPFGLQTCKDPKDPECKKQADRVDGQREVGELKQCLAAAGIALATGLGDAAFALGVGAALRAGILAFGMGRAATTLAREPLVRDPTVPMIVGSQMQGQMARDMMAVAAVGAIGSDVETIPLSEALGMDIGVKSFVPVLATVEAVKAARSTCQENR